MLISTGGADRPATFPPELPIHADAEMHLRGYHMAPGLASRYPGDRAGPQSTAQPRGGFAESK